MPRVVAPPSSLPLQRKISLPSPNRGVDRRKSKGWQARMGSHHGSLSLPRVRESKHSAVV
jgi:hypothetical protein